jgi:hypothetical protein
MARSVTTPILLQASSYEESETRPKTKRARNEEGGPHRPLGRRAGVAANSRGGGLTPRLACPTHSQKPGRPSQLYAAVHPSPKAPDALLGTKRRRNCVSDSFLTPLRAPPALLGIGRFPHLCDPQPGASHMPRKPSEVCGRSSRAY